MVRVNVTSPLMMCLCFAVIVDAGPFENPGITTSEIRVWANEIIDFQPTGSGSSAELASNALGRSDSVFVSLGELDVDQISQQNSPGSITLSLPYAITNGPGWDFAVFENAGTFFTDPFIFAELAIVEVSSNGSDFLRFPATSLNVEPDTGNADTELEAEFGRDFAGANTTNISNLAGIHPAGVGTGFDLDVLSDAAATIDIDLDRIEYVRIVDVPGDGSFLDAEGRGILDTWPTAAPSGGFDLDGVGARYPLPEPNSSSMLFVGLISLGMLRLRAVEYDQ